MENNQIIISKHVRFHENVYPFHNFDKNLYVNTSSHKKSDFLNIDLLDLPKHVSRNNSMPEQVSMCINLNSENHNSNLQINVNYSNIQDRIHITLHQYFKIIIRIILM